MRRNLWKIFIMVLVSISYVFGAHVYKDYRNIADVVRPAYDTMRTSLQQDFDSRLNENEIMPKKRNKRNTIPLNHNYNEVVRRNPVPFDQNEYYDTQTSESNNDWAVLNSQGYPFSDLVCTRRSEAQTHITVSEPSTSAAPAFALSFALLAKYAFFLFAAFWVKAFLFKLLIIPLKVLIGLKAISLINSLLLGALLFKSKFRKSYALPYPPYSYPTTPGTITALPGTTPAAAASSSSSSAASDPYDDEYVDVVRPGEDLKRILEYVKKRNKNW